MNPPTSPAPSPVSAIGVPRQMLAGLAGGVVLAHMVVMQWVGGALQADARLVTRPFVTRAVALSTDAAPQAPAAGQAAPAPGAAPTATPRKQAVAAKAPARPPSAFNTNAAQIELATPVTTPAAPETVAPLAPEPVAETLAAAPEPLPVPLPAPLPLPSPAQAASAPLPAAAAVEMPPPKAPIATVAYTVPGSVRLLYKTTAHFNGSNWNVNGELLWLQDGATYDAKLELSLFHLSKIYASKGAIGADGLLPQRFSDKFRSSEVAAHFERDKQRITFSANTPSVPLKPGMQDWLSSIVQIGAMFGGAPGKYPPGTQLAFDIVSARSADPGVFVVDEAEKLQLPGGEVNAIKLTRAARREYDNAIDVWLAPQLGYLPVRIRITERNGDFVDQQWRATETP